MKALQIVGRKKSGKTALTIRLIPRLQERGFRVGTVKHSGHPHPLDHPGSDSALHRAAGSEATLVIMGPAAALHFPMPTDPEAHEGLIAQHLGRLDLVLIEGWAGRRGPKIEVVPADESGAPREMRHAGSGELIAVVRAPGLERSPHVDPATPVFGWDELDGLVDRILLWYRGGA